MKNLIHQSILTILILTPLYAQEEQKVILYSHNGDSLEGVMEEFNSDYIIFKEFKTGEVITTHQILRKKIYKLISETGEVIIIPRDTNPGNGKRNERRRKKISFSFQFGGFPTGPSNDIEKAMISSGWNQTIPRRCFVFCKEARSHPHSSIYLGLILNLNYRLTNGNSLSLIYSISNIGSTTGYQRQEVIFPFPGEHRYDLRLDYSVRLLATVYSIQFKNVRMGLGPAFYSIKLWNDKNLESESLQKYNKVGLLLDGRISYPAYSHLYFELIAQYQLAGKVEIGPIRVRGSSITEPCFFCPEPEVLIPPPEEFPSTKVSYDQVFYGFGLGVRF